MTGKFGLSAALTTPFLENGEIATDALIKQAKRALSSGCDSVTLFGTTGEGSSIGGRERANVLSASLNAGIDAKNIVVGVLVDSAQDAAEQASAALGAGVKNILLAPPSYFKNVSDDGLFAWFSSVFDEIGASARDILVYNIPSVTMVALSVDLIGRLRKAFPGVVTGVKDSSGDWPYTQRLLAEHSDLIILIGDERHLAQGVRLGGQGAISGCANFLPAEIRAMAVDGKDDARVQDLVVELLKYPVTPAVKVLVSYLTGEEIWHAVRPPLVSISAENRKKIEAAFESLFSSKAA
ncbi:dihydrodipicolinate synthase family protein [Agrobacterium larrymoorei]|uniref:Dihydrodipicolinate synthase family protein n=1 Tax=Agrobacterium larrymoorei TaxID=160699 RepID=A0A4D7DV83_9HYPH|nr:dihydrodipicolinate synthase family protein [Agrobacterium larrymoorei]QCJ00349.1 dihydrodipicolinate synthase family protein [Agrobacterium larrymoorei]QYA09206.1 dihydrodipicolinate synthase family protein [Agrobacterium larrymoorei]